MSDAMITGVCQFCGQSATLAGNMQMEGRDADDYITQHCKCDRAVHLRARNDLDDRVSELLASDFMQGFEQNDVNTVEAVNSVAYAVLDELIDGVQLTLPCGDVVKLKRDFDGGVEMTRTFKRTRRR